MNTMKFEFNYKGNFKEIDVRTEKLAVIMAKGQSDEIRIQGEILMSEEVSYGMGDDLLVSIDKENMIIRIDTSDLEDDLMSRNVDFESSRIVILIPDGMKVRVESELGKIRFEHVNADSDIDSEIGSITIDEASGNVNIESEIGAVRVKKGDFSNFFCTTEVGNIDIQGIKANELRCETEVAQINIKEAEVSNVTITSETGNIEYQLLPIKQNQSKIDSEIGKVKIILPHEINLDVKARSEMGTVSSFLKNTITSKLDEGVKFTSEVINDEFGKISMEVSTEIGSIDLLNDDTTIEEESKKFTNNKLNQEINRAMNEVSKVTKVLASPALRKSIGGAFSNLGEVIKNSVQTALKEADVTIKESMKDMKADMQKQRQDMKSENDRNRQERRYQRGFVDGNQSYRKPEERLSDNEKSRLKILDLLEQGKINHEEAEKLLKAISK